MPPKGERRKQQIIHTAKDMFIEKGFQSTHIGQVCEKLGIARGTVYQYFSNKKEILYSLLDSVIEQIEDVLDQDEVLEFLNTKPDIPDIEKYLHKRITTSLNILISEPIVIKLIFNQIAGVDREVHNRVDSSLMKVRDVMSRSIQEIMKWNIYKPDLNPKIAATMLLGGIMMLIHEHDKNQIDIFDDNVINSIVNYYLRGTLNR